MSSYNRVILMGNLTRDPELNFLPNQTPVVDFGIACNDKYKDKEGVEHEDVLFADCKAFGRMAENINKFLSKGKPVLVEGKMASDSWEDRTTGAKRTKHYVKLQTFTFVGGRDGSGSKSEPVASRPVATSDIPF